MLVYRGKITKMKMQKSYHCPNTYATNCMYVLISPVLSIFIKFITITVMGQTRLKLKMFFNTYHGWEKPTEATDVFALMYYLLPNNCIHKTAVAACPSQKMSVHIALMLVCVFMSGLRTAEVSREWVQSPCSKIVHHVVTDRHMEPKRSYNIHDYSFVPVSKHKLGITSQMVKNKDQKFLPKKVSVWRD